MDRWTVTGGWQRVSDYPHPQHRSTHSAPHKLHVQVRFCATAEEGADRIFGLGGVTEAHRRLAHLYTVSTDTWTQLPGLRSRSYDSGCTIIRERTTAKRRLILVGADKNSVQESGFNDIHARHAKDQNIQLSGCGFYSPGLVSIWTWRRWTSGGR